MRMIERTPIRILPPNEVVWAGETCVRVSLNYLVGMVRVRVKSC